MTRRLRVLAIAYACSPYRGSEPGVGWGWINAIATRHDVDVITAEFSKPEIERFYEVNPDQPKNIRFHYVQEKCWHYRLNPWWGRIEASCLRPLVNAVYVGWQRAAFRLAQRLCGQVNFDVLHLITLVGFRFPGRFWQMDLPFVWGPIGGLENTPWAFLPLMGLSGALYFTARNTINAFHKRFLSGPKHAFSKAHGSIIAA